MNLVISEEYCASILEGLNKVLLKELVGKNLLDIQNGKIHESLFCGKFADPTCEIIIQQQDILNVNSDFDRNLDIVVRFYRGYIDK